ncbi:hypothetical protein [Paradesulfitobacterium ferrireducens]|nr:hypothetical protein [Paradesulfitobacterium ferrireducens]
MITLSELEQLAAKSEAMIAINLVNQIAEGNKTHSCRDLKIPVRTYY